MSNSAQQIQTHNQLIGKAQRLTDYKYASFLPLISSSEIQNLNNFPTPTVPATFTSTPTPTQTQIPTASNTPRITATINLTPSSTLPSTPTKTQTQIPTATFTATPTATPTATSLPAKPTFYVAINGNDANPGTLAQPWRTIQKAASTLVAGDTVQIRSGTYNEHILLMNSGTAGNYIVYMAYPGETAIIDGTGVALNLTDYRADGLIDIIGKSFIKISGLTVMNSTFNCVNLYRYDGNLHNDYAENIILSGLSIQNCSQKGISANYTRHLLIENNSINKVDYSSGIAVWRSDDATVDHNTITNAHYYHEKQGAHDEALTISIVNSFEVKNNSIDFTLANPWPSGDTSFYSDRIGIDVKETSQNGKVYKNTVRHMTADGIYVDPWTAGTVVNGVQLPTLNHIDIFQNQTIDSAGITIGAEVAGGTAEFINIYNNLVINAMFAGIQISGGHGNGIRKNITIYNNTIYGAMRAGGNGGAGIYVATENLASSNSDKPVIIRNNISMFDFPELPHACVGQVLARTGLIDSLITADHNLVNGPTCNSYLPIYCPDCREVGIRISAGAASVFVNYLAQNFHLLATAPAVNAGIAVNLVSSDFDGLARTQSTGGAIDVGAYEFK